MRLNIAPELWHDLCRMAALFPTSTLHLYQHEGCIKRFTVEHGPWGLAPHAPTEVQGTGSDLEPYRRELHEPA